MITITIEESVDLAKTHFKSVTELKEYLLALDSGSDLTEAHKRILDTRLAVLDRNPNNGRSWEEVKRDLENWE